MPNCTCILRTESALAGLCIVSRVRTPSFPPRNPVQVKKNPTGPRSACCPVCSSLSCSDFDCQPFLSPLPSPSPSPSPSPPAFGVSISPVTALHGSNNYDDLVSPIPLDIILRRFLAFPGLCSIEPQESPPRGPASKGPNNTCRPEATTTLCSALLCSGAHFLWLQPSTPRGTRQTFANLFALLNSPPQNTPRSAILSTFHRDDISIQRLCPIPSVFGIPRFA